MTEYLPENEDKLNQAAKKALLKVGAEHYDPTGLYCLELAMWAWEENKVDKSRAPDALRETLEQLLMTRLRFYSESLLR